MSEPPKHLVVTDMQLSDGWLERDGLFIRSRDFHVVKNQGDGTFVVANPEWTLWIQAGRAAKAPVIPTVQCHEREVKEVARGGPE